MTKKQSYIKGKYNSNLLNEIKVKYLNQIWENPFLYKVLQATLAGGGHSLIKKFLLSKIPKTAKTILDQGCGTGEYALLFGDKYTGIDISKEYIKDAKVKYPGKFLVGSADKMTVLKSNFFDIVFNVGLHHHLTDKQAKKAVIESLRVLKKGGSLIIIDAMLPKRPLNIIGLFLRKMDRGGNVRYWKDTLALLPSDLKYKYQILSSFPFDYITIIAKKV